MSIPHPIQNTVQHLNDRLLDVWANLEVIARLAESVGGGDITMTGDALNLTMQRNCDLLMAIRNDLDGLALQVSNIANPMPDMV